MIAVIPTSRAVNLANFGPLIDDGVRFIVVDDTDGTIKVNHPQFEVYNWSDRKRLLGSNEIAIPRKNGACRDLGFYIAWKESDADEIVVALDDDCVVEAEDFPEQVRSRFRVANRKTLSTAPRFYNHFDLFDDPDLSSLFPRGFPYSDRIAYRPTFDWTQVSAAPLFNLGLWKGIPDINSIDKIGLLSYDFPEANLECENVVLPKHTYTSLCSGNMQFRSSVIPAIYQLPMMIEIIPNWPIDRYGDIWGGHILKTLLDVRGDCMSVGGPMVRHLRAGPVEQNIRREHLSHLVNEEFFALLCALRTELKPDSYLNMMATTQDFFTRSAEKVTPILREYLRHLNGPLLAWIRALS